ncbi:MalY/PatB family protein [Pokkaliibacter sp. CJK22405]|uniref:MalY/PatB family protein n=1 Tax=Pokkaliibacter sp. CJK22405 TaxID=3384615 RepID=UPI00398553FA
MAGVNTPFDAVPERRGTHSVKWDSAANGNVLPLWVADMDFTTAPAITEALVQRARHGIFGYTRVPESFFTAFTNWLRRRHALSVTSEALLYTTGVVPALSAIIQALSIPGDGVIVPSPAYNCFFSSIRNSGCTLVSSPLKEENGHYGFDFEDLASKVAEPKNTLLLLCNPHNPVGRSWTEAELRQLGELCFAHNVTVISDEIHCDLTMPGFTHVPFASLGEAFMQHSVSCFSPSKAFNLAGLQVATILAADPETRRRIDRRLNINEVCEISPFAVTAVEAAYNEGEVWLDALRGYLDENYQALKRFIETHLPQLKVTPLQATYLVWIDCRALSVTSQTLARSLYDDHGLWINEGTVYGPEGDGFIRINIATSRARLDDALSRLFAALVNEPPPA